MVLVGEWVVAGWWLRVCTVTEVKHTQQCMYQLGVGGEFFILDPITLMDSFDNMK